MLPVQRIQGVNNLGAMDSALDNPSPTTKIGIETAGGGREGGGGGILVSRTTQSAVPSHFPPPAIIRFDDKVNFASPALRDFDLSSNKMFMWKPENSSVVVTRIQWFARNSTASMFDDYSRIIQDFNPMNGTSEPANSAFTNVNANTGAQLLLSNERIHPLYRWAMTIRLDWKTDFKTGYTQSGIFTVIEQANLPESSAFNTTASGNFNDWFGMELFFNETMSASTSTSTSTPDSTATATATATGSASSHAGDAAAAAGGLAGSESGGNGKGGLSTGVKAGIGAAVGVVGLLLLLGILFFFLRRKKRLSRGDPTTASSFLISDTQKMVNHPSSSSNKIPAPQISPIAHQDENESLRAPSRGQVTVGGGGGNGGGNGAGMGPGMGPGIGASSDGGNISLNSSIEDLPTGVSRHLVEEGMTREQILLLEEEERQLDAAIERAARRH